MYISVILLINASRFSLLVTDIRAYLITIFVINKNPPASLLAIYSS